MAPKILPYVDQCKGMNDLMGSKVQHFLTFVFLLLCGVCGLFVGSYLEPAVPLYPFLPTHDEVDALSNAEFIVNVVMGGSTILFVLLGTLTIGASFALSIPIAALIGIGYHALTYLRAGDIPEVALYPIVGFLVGLLSVFGLAALFKHIGDLRDMG